LGFVLFLGQLRCPKNKKNAQNPFSAAFGGRKRIFEYKLKKIKKKIGA